jgi:hypothetical protein
MMAANQGQSGPIVIDGETIGVHLAPNSVGQHAMGIDRLLRRMGADSADAHGIRSFDGYVSTSVPEWTRDDLSHDEKLWLDVGPKPRKLKSTSAVLCVEGGIQHAVGETARYSPLSVVTGAWDDSSFAVRGWDDAGRRIVDLVQEGLETRDLVIWVSGDIDMGHGHLCIARRSLVPAAMVARFDEDVAEQRRLHAAADATGIAERLAQIGPQTPFGRMRAYHALAPAWIDAETAQRSIHPVRFFLNPTEQDRNNFGWFTVEELDQWIIGQGPIPKNPKEGKRP